ncbi:cell cycle checkpoint protein RAD17 isoform X2 [Agrilus planipennis]|uniref:Cell cycle checkpoint protein RAD17 isoform X2 n=1 Tax=Agrilus planipennis TaxID=224129 RepID=A0A1W4WQS7_AGRPL|nr:cell cycle checkpoint protein RAD17 isoform X2 [Agrilus planipennis]
MNKKSNKNWISLDIKVDEVKNDFPVGTKVTRDSLKVFAVPSETKKAYNFFEKVIPTIESHLAVHSKKIKEVEEWLLRNVKDKCGKGTTSILLITGPAGSGKSATINVLCNKLDIRISEWVNPVDQDYELSKGPGQSAQFLEFLVQSKYLSLLEDSGKKLTLVEDFPNSVIRKPDEFFTILEKVYYKARSAIVFICADEDMSNNISHQLFPQNIRDLYKIENITFNACSVTLMKNSLKRACSLILERSDLFTPPHNDIIEAIVITSCGDIRSAMNQLYFASLKGFVRSK